MLRHSSWERKDHSLTGKRACASSRISGPKCLIHRKSEGVKGIGWTEGELDLDATAHNAAAHRNFIRVSICGELIGCGGIRCICWKLLLVHSTIHCHHCSLHFALLCWCLDQEGQALPFFGSWLHSMQNCSSLSSLQWLYGLAVTMAPV